MPPSNSKEGENEVKIENKTNGEYHPSHIELGLKKPMSEYMLKDIPQLEEQIAELFSNILRPLPLKLPPLLEVLHKIPLIDESKQLKHRLPKCPEAFRPELAREIEQYTTTGWWIPAADKQATPMLCIPKKNGTLHTVFDLRQQNDNIWKDVTPLTEQDAIQRDIACARFRSKLDMTEYMSKCT